MAIVVKLVQPGKIIQEFEVSSNPTLEGLIEAANRSGANRLQYVSGGYIRNHETLEIDDELYDNDKVTFATPTKGNQVFEVKVVIIGSSIISLPADDGMTIDQVLAQLSPENRAKIFGADGRAIYEYRIGDSEALSGSYVLSRPATGVIRLVLSTRTKGNKKWFARIFHCASR